MRQISGIVDHGDGGHDGPHLTVTECPSVMGLCGSVSLSARERYLWLRPVKLAARTVRACTSKRRRTTLTCSLRTAETAANAACVRQLVMVALMNNGVPARGIALVGYDILRLRSAWIIASMWRLQHVHCCMRPSHVAAACLPSRSVWSVCLEFGGSGCTVSSKSFAMYCLCSHHAL